MKPEQAALTSNAGQPLAPRRCCSRQAVDGKMRSGVVVPTHDQVDVLAATPAASSARVAAWKREVAGGLAFGGDSGARGCRCARRSTRRSCRPSFRDRRWSATFSGR